MHAQRAVMCIFAAHTIASLAAPPSDENFEHAFSTAEHTINHGGRSIGLRALSIASSHICTYKAHLHLHSTRCMQCCILHRNAPAAATAVQTPAEDSYLTPVRCPCLPPLHSLPTAAGTFNSRLTPSPASRGRMRSGRRPRAPLATCTRRRCPPRQTQRQ